MNHNIFDTYTEADWNAMLESYLRDMNEQELPEAKVWGLY